MSSDVSGPAVKKTSPINHPSVRPQFFDKTHMANDSLSNSAKGIASNLYTWFLYLIESSKTFLARLCEQAERYDEMVSYMKEVANVSLAWH